MDDLGGGITTRSKSSRSSVSDNTGVAKVNTNMADAAMTKFMKEIKEGNDTILSRVASIDTSLAGLTTKVDKNITKLDNYIGENDGEICD